MLPQMKAHLGVITCDKCAEPMEIESTTLWDFPQQSYGVTRKGDNNFNGVTPAALIWNLLQRYTKVGDLVVDPMCGSGTTIDVAIEENRRVIGFDLAPKRADIIKADARSIPIQANSADLVFVDPPYSDNIKYSEHPSCLGKISCETSEYFDELDKVACEVYRVLKSNKITAWLIGDQWRGGKFVPTGFKLFVKLSLHFQPVDVICVVRHNQRSNTPLWHHRARKFNFYLRGFKYLFIMRKI